MIFYAINVYFSYNDRMFVSFHLPIVFIRYDKICKKIIHNDVTMINDLTFSENSNINFLSYINFKNILKKAYSWFKNPSPNFVPFSLDDSLSSMPGYLILNSENSPGMGAKHKTQRSMDRTFFEQEKNRLNNTTTRDIPRNSNVNSWWLF